MVAFGALALLTTGAPLVFSVMSGTAHAQALATISGTVQDSSGGALVNAPVTVLNQDTGLQRAVTSDPQGHFVAEFSVAASAGGAFGLAATDDNGQLRFAAVDDNTNTVSVWHFDTGS